jgi:hypothetical protein
MLFTAGILSYKAVVHFLQPKQEDAAVANQNETVTDDKIGSGPEGLINNLIFCYDDDSKEISKIILEVLDSNNKQLNYITIPVRTQFTMSASLYKKLVLDYPEIPQVLKLSVISKCFSFDKEFKNGAEIIEDLLRTDINYYTAMPQSTYEKIFTEKNVNLADGSGTLPEEVFSNEYKSFLQTLDTKEKVKAYIKDIYPDLKTDIALNDKLKYIDSYYEISSGQITFEILKGNNQNSAYVMDPTLAAEQLTGIE